MQNNVNQVFQTPDNGSVNNQFGLQNNFKKVSEAESRGEYNAGYSRGPTVERPVQRSWVPPQPPPVVMAEAAAAIRQPKKSAFQSEPLTDDQFLARSSELTDELQRITKVSESGGVITEANGGGSSMVNTQIQTEEDNSSLET